MSVPPPIDRYKEEAVPLVFLLIVSVSLFVVPPVALGELGVTLLIPLLILIVLLAVWPYACAVAVGTLPLLYANIASFAAPDTDTDAFHSFSLDTVLRHTYENPATVCRRTVSIRFRWTQSSDTRWLGSHTWWERPQSAPS